MTSAREFCAGLCYFSVPLSRTGHFPVTVRPENLNISAVSLHCRIWRPVTRLLSLTHIVGGAYEP